MFTHSSSPPPNDTLSEQYAPSRDGNVINSYSADKFSATSHDGDNAPVHDISATGIFPVAASPRSTLLSEYHHASISPGAAPSVGSDCGSTAVPGGLYPDYGGFTHSRGDTNSLLASGEPDSGPFVLARPADRVTHSRERSAPPAPSVHPDDRNLQLEWARQSFAEARMFLDLGLRALAAQCNERARRWLVRAECVGKYSRAA